MKVDFIFSRRDAIGSRLISWASKFENLGLVNNPSHGAILINKKFVIESVFGSGVRIVPYFKWLEINEELYRIPSNDITREFFDNEILVVWGKPYDWFGIFYFAYRYLRLMLFKTPLPTKNKWQKTSHLFCIELIGRLSNSYYSMTSPAKMCKMLLEKL
jgi:hypothetical protein